MRNFCSVVPSTHFIQMDGMESGVGVLWQGEESPSLKEFQRSIAVASRCLCVAMETTGRDLSPSEESVLDSFLRWTASITRPERLGGCGCFVYVNMNTGVSLVFIPDLSSGEYQLALTPGDAYEQLVREDRVRKESHSGSSVYPLSVGAADPFWSNDQNKAATKSYK